jgi:hypothetical protein
MSYVFVGQDERVRQSGGGASGATRNGEKVRFLIIAKGQQRCLIAFQRLSDKNVYQTC